MQPDGVVEVPGPADFDLVVFAGQRGIGVRPLRHIAHRIDRCVELDLPGLSERGARKVWLIKGGFSAWAVAGYGIER